MTDRIHRSTVAPPPHSSEARTAPAPRPPAPGTNTAAPPCWGPARPARGALAEHAERRLATLNASHEAVSDRSVVRRVDSMVASALTAGALGSAAEARDRAVAGVNALYARLLARDGGALSDRSAHVLNDAIDSAQQSIDTIRQIRNDVLATTVSTLSAAGGLALGLMTAGASTAAAAASRTGPQELARVRELVERSPHLPSPSDFTPKELALMRQTLHALRLRAATVKLSAEETGIARTLLRIFTEYGR